MTGVMACESNLRKQQYQKNGCNSFDANNPKSSPMGFWTEQDVLNYMKINELEYASVYGEIIPDPNVENALTTSGCKRTGCMFCMFGVHLEHEPNRFQLMKETHPKQYAYCMKNLGLAEVLDYIGVPY
jgi:3'-phosphoadenosine 5'-phosphosulfate sulfotransferase (PAPS reductase)/FAD synthetase